MNPTAVRRVVAALSSAAIGMGAIALAYRLTGTSAVGHADDFACPVAGPVTFGDGWGAGRKGHIHHGIDIQAPAGRAIVAPTAGTLIRRWDATGGGNWATVRLADGTEFWNMHLNAFTAANGSHVERGQVIGSVGSTGDATGPHDHFEYHPRGGPAVPADAMVRAWCSPGGSPPIVQPPTPGRAVEVFDTDPAPDRLARDIGPQHYVVQSLAPGVNRLLGVSIVAASKRPGVPVQLRAIVYADAAQTVELAEARRTVVDNAFTEFVFDHPVPVDPKGVYVQLYNDSPDTSVGIWFARSAYQHGNSWRDGENYRDPSIVDLDLKAVITGMNA